MAYRLGEKCGKTQDGKSLYYIGKILGGMLGDFTIFSISPKTKRERRTVEEIMVSLDGEIYETGISLGIKVVNISPAPSGWAGPLQWEAWAIYIASSLANNRFVYKNSVLSSYLIRI